MKNSEENQTQFSHKKHEHRLEYGDKERHEKISWKLVNTYHLTYVFVTPTHLYYISKVYLDNPN